ncbi:helix-turn-helix domain-containing protein [Pedobacter cryoconitis]|uniref:DNA-binding XRE family transcriptional regulator n=1 Tax=Pedobacter cryoconitis TaxID=188932 RepID=A0A327ST93_9SPHI|nr:helix-turn-helix transcriptional regulator [Pedobacter cryoconitis]RAJ31732.1 DNA-binding XRE family transcriptional regulator [Pedobacter cryoconitis]
MSALKTNHIGENIKKIRLLRGMKQATFAKELGIAQQNVSKMEKKTNIPDEQLELAAKILGTNLEALKDFDENKAVFQTNIINENQVNHFNSVNKDILEYFELKLAKKDEEIERLKEQLAKQKPSRSKTKTESVTTPLRKVSAG